MQYDIVIVGAGSAGAVLAARLSESGERSVALLEAGPDYPDFEGLPDELKYGYGRGYAMAASPAHNWDFTGTGTADGRELYVPSGKVTGGTSAINGQIFLRAIPGDFDAWVAAGNDIWSFDAVLPYFRKIEHDDDFDGHYHGSDGPLPIRRFARERWHPAPTAFYEACRALGFPDCPDANAPGAIGVGACPFNERDRIRISTSLAYLPAARPRPNFSLVPETLARRIRFDGLRAVGVEVEHDGAISVIEGREIIVCAGAIGSPALLLRSGVGPAGELRSLGIPVVLDLPGVGRDLQEHPIVGTNFETTPEHSLEPDEPHGQCFLRLTSTSVGTDTDMFVRELQFGNQYILWSGVYAPASRGALTLTSADPHTPPLISYRFLDDESDRRRMREGVRLCISIAESEGFRRIIAARITPADVALSSDAALDDWIWRSVESGRHITSTARMGPSGDTGAVTDQECRVHGLEGLRVVDASVMPTIVRANPNATVIMLAERVADLLAATA